MRRRIRYAALYIQKWETCEQQKPILLRQKSCSRESLSELLNRHHMLRLTVVVFGVLLLGVHVYPQRVSKIEGELLGHLDKLEKASHDGGSAGDDENTVLQETFVRYGTRGDVLKYSFPKLKHRM